MAPSKSLSQASSSQGKKQQSISSFFTPKPPVAQELHSSPPSDAHAPIIDGGLSINSDNDEDISQRNAPRALKRRLEQEQSDVENDDPNPKRRQSEDLDIQDAERRQTLVDAAPSKLNETSQKFSDRTSKYAFSSPPVAPSPDEEDSEEIRKRKEHLHREFVKKLGRPDSIAEIKRRNHGATEENGDGEDAADEEEEEIQPVKSKKGTKKGTLTPMEKQVLEIKGKHMDALLVIEVGYKYRFFGEDARAAAKELGIVCIPGKFRYDEHPSEAHLNRFASASFPTHRLHVHVKRLVQAGHKVGIVRQIETAALKAVGDNRNTPFIRKLTNLYTKATYVDDLEDLEGPVAAPHGGALATGYLLCITESNAKGWGSDEKVYVGLVAVQPATGDIVYDDFEDGFMRSEIETRLLHIAPAEFLIVGETSKATERLIKHLSGSKANVFGDQARVERVDKLKTTAAESYSHISNFYAEKMKDGDGDASTKVLDKVHQLSEHVTICLSAMINHMSEYGLEHVFDLTTNFQPFSARSYMLINGNTLTSLEIYRNQTDHSQNGSLFWTLDRTRTRFGQRLLRKWVGRPLLDEAKLAERITAVEELKDGERTRNVDKLKRILGQTKSDLEKVLIRIYYKKCTRSELLTVLQILQQVSNEFANVTSPEKAGFESIMINEAIAALPKISDRIVSFLDRINAVAAKGDDKYSFFRDEHETEAISDHKLGIASVEDDLESHRKVAAEKLKKKMVGYVTVAGIEYLIEVDNKQLKNVPASWAKISGTKKLSRFHTPEVVKLVRERDQHKEALAAACDEAFSEFLAEIGSQYQELRDVVQSLAVLDCLLSLAEVAQQPGYVKPTFSQSVRINISKGRHPMVEQLLLDAYVSNDTNLSSGTDSDDPRALLVTGPNMGGKSSYVRQVALICIMGQIGSYVPAESAELGMLDAVFTRMGAGDNIMAGESTFMVELSETSDILKQATNRSLVLLDELGRGTSTHDGVAIAEAVLRQLVERGSLVLFVTHYQSLARLEGVCEGLRNVHVTFREDDDGEGVTFLYEIGDGVAHRSYGLNVARLANVPKSVLEVAAVKSKELEDSMARKGLANLSRKMMGLLSGGESVDLDAFVAAVEQL
ncbi:DNA mismatch repair protein MSH3 [Aulographum hederae CBS 113979]|uniref:MutS protein homolog 3 n=1 Tax=Aulographum hederae CBS 113979 TaxID=1176131 RepID=A0A6G1H3P1_9PEZI|nr:DNA mismatch repair protein MSH3 [Aulographum hederae CBS 113979]